MNYMIDLYTWESEFRIRNSSRYQTEMFYVTRASVTFFCFVGPGKKVWSCFSVDFCQ